MDRVLEKPGGKIMNIIMLPQEERFVMNYDIYDLEKRRIKKKKNLKIGTSETQENLK